MPEKYFKSINQIIDRLADHYGFSKWIQEEKLFRDWEVIVGVSLAKQCTPKCIDQGVLFIEASNDFWKKVVLCKKEELLHLVRSYLNNNYIQKIKFI